MLCLVIVTSNSLRPHGQRSLVGYCPWGFSGQEYWSGLPCPPPGDLPDPGIESVSPGLQADSFHLLSSIHREWAELSLLCPKRDALVWGGLVGCRLWGCTESDTTEAT